jgi:hypothetical protein
MTCPRSTVPTRKGIVPLPVRHFVATLAVLCLSIWIAFPLFFGAIAVRATFDELPSRVLAGEVNARMAAAQDAWIGIAAALFLAAVLVLLHRDRSAGSARRALLTRLPLGAISASVIARFIVEPRMLSLRRSLPVAIAELPKSDPNRVAFGRLHALSSGLMLFVVLSGVISAALIVPLLAARPEPVPAPPDPEVDDVPEAIE